MKGRNDEARAVLQRLHDDNENHLFWEQEYQQILAQVQREMEEKRQESWTHVFKNKSDRMRLFLAICAITATQTSGAAVIQVFQVSALPCCSEMCLRLPANSRPRPSSTGAWVSAPGKS